MNQVVSVLMTSSVVVFFCRREHEENFATVVNEMGKASAHVRVL